jgi:hypothetical protein
MFNYLQDQYLKLIFFRGQECKKLIGVKVLVSMLSALCISLSFIHVQNPIKHHIIIAATKVLESRLTNG